MESAQSFALHSTHAHKVVRAVESAASRLRKPSAVLLFLCGSVGEQIRRVAELLREAKLGVPILIGVGAGVLNEHGEIEAESGAAGLVWIGGPARTCVLAAGHDDLGTVLDRELSRGDETTAFVLLRPDRLDPSAFSTLSLRGRVVLGGGTAGTGDIFGLDSRGVISRGSLGMLCWSGSKPLVGVTRASRLITPLRPVTRVSGSMLLEIDGEQALDVLSAAGNELEGQPLIFVALAKEPSSLSAAQGRIPELLLRPIQGVDPSRRGIVLGEDVQDSAFAAFAVRDAARARADLEHMAREIAHASAGAAPCFALYVNCAGRGSGLYSAANVDTRLLRSRFGHVPMAGLQSSFELAPYHDQLALHLYTGVLALFTSPS